MNTKKLVKYILGEYKKFKKWDDKLEKLGIKIFDYNHDIFGVFNDIICEIYEVPEENATKVDFNDENYFCRDRFGDIIYKFLDDEIKEDDFFYFFENWKKLFDKEELFDSFWKKIEKA